MWAPPVDIYESGDQLMIRAEVPGMNANDIDIRIDSGVLHIRGERKIDPQIQQQTAYRLERRYGGFTRSFTLPTTLDAGKTAARYSDGVLEVSVPKAESAKPKRVRIEVA